MMRITLFTLSIVGASIATVLPAFPVDKPTLPSEIRVAATTDLPPKNFTQKLPGGQVSFEMVYVPGGEYLMGSPKGESGRQFDEGPPHKVKVRPFWLGKCEVT